MRENENCCSSPPILFAPSVSFKSKITAQRAKAKTNEYRCAETSQLTSQRSNVGECGGGASRETEHEERIRTTGAVCQAKYAETKTAAHLTPSSLPRQSHPNQISNLNALKRKQMNTLCPVSLNQIKTLISTRHSENE